MNTTIIVNIDEKGELQLDLSGYAHRACEFEEAELRRIMAEMGLGVRIKGAKSKAQNPTGRDQLLPGERQRVKL